MFVTLMCTSFERSLSPVLEVLHEWLDSWSGIGVIERGMARQGYDLQLTRYANEGWRATFFLTGREHSMTQATGSVWEPTPWRAVQGAAWEALRRLEAGALTPHSSSPVVGSQFGFQGLSRARARPCDTPLIGAASKVPARREPRRNFRRTTCASSGDGMPGTIS